MVRSHRKENQTVKKGAWAPEEDRKLIAYINRYGIWNWSQMPKFAGLSRSGKSCRLRWLNYLNPDVKRGNFTDKEVEIIISMYQKFGSRWSLIAKKLPGRTDNEIKNYWHTRLKKVLSKNNLEPSVHDESPALVAAEIPSSLAEAIQENPQDKIKPSLPFAQVSILEGYYQEADDTSSTTSTTTTTLGWDFSADSDDERRSRQLETAFAEMNIGDDSCEINNIPSSWTQDFMLENYLCVEEEEQEQIGFLHSGFDLPSWSLLVDPLSPSSCFYNDVYCDILFNFPEKRGTTDFEEPYFWL